MKLIEDWKSAWRWYSVNALAVAGAIPVAWASVPADWRADCPAWVMAGLSLLVALSGIVGRVVDQSRNASQ